MINVAFLPGFFRIFSSSILRLFWGVKLHPPTPKK